MEILYPQIKRLKRLVEDSILHQQVKVMDLKLDRIISIICVILACLLLAYSTVCSFLEKEGSTSDRIISVLDSSSNFTENDKNTIETILETGKDKEVMEKIKAYIESDDEEGLENYLQTILNDQS